MTEFRKGDVVDVRATVAYVGNSNVCIHIIDERSSGIWVERKSCTLVKRREIGVGDRVRSTLYNEPKGTVLFCHGENRWVLWDNVKCPSTYLVLTLKLVDD